ncbi:hypothetical protein WJX84_010253 [Apatococcus fuscideae]|uniref:Uncharacterized protein n=1 Tax=Apatococcus fuscideae TaxID=2026836 RepID=A0AAW1SKP2_9CHLO
MITGMASLDDQCRQEQQDELAGLQAIFGDHACACDVQTGELKVTVPDPETLPRLLLRCERPATYPMKDPPYPTITAGHLSHDLCDWAQDELLQQFTPGQAVLFDWIEWLKGEPRLWPHPGDGHSPKAQASKPSTSEPDACSTPPHPSNTGDKQLAMCYMHHLLSSKKRRDIRHWAEELSMRGFVKCGYPGILVVEGLAPDLHEYLSRLKALPWAAFQVRLELEASEYRHGQGTLMESLKGVEEVEGMTIIGSRMEALGLKQLFLDVMGMGKHS